MAEMEIMKRNFNNQLVGKVMVHSTRKYRKTSSIRNESIRISGVSQDSIRIKQELIRNDHMDQRNTLVRNKTGSIMIDRND